MAADRFPVPPCPFPTMPMGRAIRFEILSGGRNSRVAKAVLEDGSAVVVKQCFHHPEDPRDRLGREFAALSFLGRAGERRIPEPLALLREDNAAVYAFVAGDPPGTPAPGDMDACAAFFLDLQAHRNIAEAQEFPPASEAVFSLAQAQAVLEHRRRRLDAADGPLAGQVRAFLTEAFDPALAEISARTRKAAGDDFFRELAWERRVLSPSDFGLHNALRRPSGLAFLDFEYFGWDDPVKMLADFTLHPGMGLAPPMARRFAATVGIGLDDPDLWPRLCLTLPLVRLKWTLILLNEFLPRERARRLFCNPDADPAATQARQLDKARQMLSGFSGAGLDLSPLGGMSLLAGKVR